MDSNYKIKFYEDALEGLYGTEYDIEKLQFVNLLF